MTYEQELAKIEAEFDELNEKLADLRARRRKIVAKRQTDFVLQRPDGAYWIQYRDHHGPTGSYGWSKIPVESSAVFRADTYKRAFWYASDLVKIGKAKEIDVREVDRTDVK